jgi:hypothetical protein
MLQQALARINDGDRLNSDLGHQSDSGYLLRLLGFELMLKAVLHTHGCAIGRSHSYRELFLALPVNVQDRIANAAADRMSGVADYSDLPAVLTTLGRILLHYGILMNRIGD